MNLHAESEGAQSFILSLRNDLKLNHDPMNSMRRPIGNRCLDQGFTIDHLNGSNTITLDVNFSGSVS